MLEQGTKYRSGKLGLYWELEISEVVSRYKNDAIYEIKSKSYPNKTRILH